MNKLLMDFKQFLKQIIQNIGYIAQKEKQNYELLKIV